MPLEYSLREKDRLAVLSLRGPLNAAQAEVLKDCARDLHSKSPTAIVLHMAELSEFPREGFRDFTQFLRSLKAKCDHIRIAELKREFQRNLAEEGLIANSDGKASLGEVLQELAGLLKAKT